MILTFVINLLTLQTYFKYPWFGGWHLYRVIYRHVLIFLVWKYKEICSFAISPLLLVFFRLKQWMGETKLEIILNEVLSVWVSEYSLILKSLFGKSMNCWILTFTCSICIKNWFQSGHGVPHLSLSYNNLIYSFPITCS